MMNLKNTFLLLFVFQLSFSAWSATVDKTSKLLNIGMVQEWGQFNPVVLSLASSEALLAFVIRGAVLRTPDGGVLPDLAENIPSKKNGSLKTEKLNGARILVATWKLKSTAKWGDGHPVVCADWKLGWLAGNNPKVSVSSRSSYQKITKIEWDEKTPQSCRLTYANDDWSFDRDLPAFLPSHLEQAVYEKFQNDNEAYERNSLYVTQPSSAGLYNGPYVIKEFKIGSHLVLTPNPHFFGEKAKIPQVIVKHIPDTSVLRANLISKEINLVSAVGFPPDTALQLDEESKKSSSDFLVHFQNSGIFQGVFFNLEKPLLQDLKVRTALSKAVDKKTLTDAFFKGKLTPAEGIYSPQSSWFEQRPPEYSLNEAKKLLEEAGWHLGKDGIREKNGKALKLLFKTSSGIKVLESIQVFICDHYKKIGVGCEIKNEPPRILLGDSVPKGEFDLALFGNPVLPDTSMTSLFSSKEIPSTQNSWAGGNVCRWRNPEVDELLSKFDQEWDPKTRGRIAKKIEQLVIKDRPFIPLYHRHEAMVYPKALKGTKDDYSGTNFAAPENWSL